ncbi:MAG: nucleotidyltransferase family protein [Methanosarcinales archaeon]
MDKEKIKKRLKIDLEPIFKRSDVIAILLYGSLAKNEYNIRSDIDVCIVAPNCKDHKLLFRELLSVVRDEKIDLRIFEFMPLYLKMEVIKNHEIIDVKDELDLYEYFYFIRKLFKDQEHRQRVSGDEMLYIFSVD